MAARAATLLRRTPLGVRVAVVVAVAAAGALLVACRPVDSPPFFEPRAFGLAVAQGDVLVESPVSTIADTSAEAGRPARMALRLVEYLRTDAVTDRIARRAGTPVWQTITNGPFTTLIDRENLARRVPAVQPPPKGKRYRVLVDVTPNRPLITFYTQAPDPATATRLLAAAKAELRASVGAVQAGQPFDTAASVHLVDEGSMPGRLVNPGMWRSVALLVLLALLGLGWIVQARLPGGRRLFAAPPVRGRAEAMGGGDWPHTKRPLPWALAGFLVMLWAIPFDALQLPISIPMDGKLDRPVLAALVCGWLFVAVTAPKALRPRLRFTAIHASVAVVFGLFALASATNLDSLTSDQELGIVIKKLAVLASYAVLFAIVASVIRPREVPRFALLMLVLGAIAAFGALIEYRLGFNVFYQLAEALPGFHVSPPGDLYKADAIGRLTIYGPTSHPLELATMLGVALPFAIVGLTTSKTRRSTILHGLAGAIILAGAFSTLRKTSMIAPVVGLSVLLAYRPWLTARRLAPLFVIIFVGVHFAAPGAVGSTLTQLMPGKVTGVLSTQDRASDYDAVTPDVERHLALGRGYESYEPHKYRILDNQYLGLLIGVGVLGLAAFLAFVVTAVRSGHRLIRGPDRWRRDTALAATAAMVVMGVATGLFDLLSFSHISYLMFFVAGLLAALSDPARQPESEPARWGASTPHATVEPPHLLVPAEVGRLSRVYEGRSAPALRGG